MPRSPPEILAYRTSRYVEVELYGESPTRPCSRRHFQSKPATRATALACSELRIDRADRTSAAEQLSSTPNPLCLSPLRSRRRALVCRFA